MVAEEGPLASCGTGAAAKKSCVGANRPMVRAARCARPAGGHPPWMDHFL